MGEKTVVVRTFSFLVITVAVYLLVWQTAVSFLDLPVYYYARLIELLSILLFAALALFTPMRFEEMGIAVPRGVLFRSLAAGGGVALLFTVGLFLVSFLRGNSPVFSLVGGDVSRTTYVLVAPLQEVLSKSVMYYGFERCFGREHYHLTNGMCALVFGIFHVVYGIRMMLLSMLLSLVTGWIFRRIRCVWGCALTHFAFGFLPACFGFL